MTEPATNATRAQRISARALHETHRWIQLDELALLPDNPNQGDEQSLEASVNEFGWIDGIVTHNGIVIAGNHRVLQARTDGETGLPGYDLSAFPLDAARRMAMALAHNYTGRAGTNDPALLNAAFNMIADVDPVLADVAGYSARPTPNPYDGNHRSGPALTDRFVVPPFSVLDSRQGYWQDRKREWLALDLASEVGRDAGLLGAGDVMGQINAGTSIFDPVLCELVYRWFTPHEGSRILDPFAGGVVRGAVAAILGHEYVGIELRPEQIAANESQDHLWAGAPGPAPRWIQGDANDVATLAAGEPFDLLFSCPPYADLEVYSDDPADLSTLDPNEFLEAHHRILSTAVGLLAPNRFAVWVVSEVRDSSKPGGPYLGFVPSTIDALRSGGAQFYNEAILVNAVGTVSVRAPRQFDAGRKVGRVHQNVIVGFTGNAGEGVLRTGNPDGLADAVAYSDVEVGNDEGGLGLGRLHENMIVGFTGDPRKIGPEFGPVETPEQPGGALTAARFGTIL